MSKTFYTEHDIQDMAAQGATRLEVNDDVVLTDLAREQATKLGIELVRSDSPPATRHPERSEGSRSEESPPVTRHPPGPDLHQRIRAAVIAKLGDQVDAAILDRIITRVLSRL